MNFERVDHLEDRLLSRNLVYVPSAIGVRRWLTTVLFGEKRSCSLKALGWVQRELHQANQIFCKRQSVFRPDCARPPYQETKVFIDEYRNEYGVGPLHSVHPIAPSTYRTGVLGLVDPSLKPWRVGQKSELRLEFHTAETEFFKIYGVRKA